MVTRRIVIAGAALLVAACSGGHASSATPTISTSAPPPSSMPPTSPAPAPSTLRPFTPPTTPSHCTADMLSGRIVPSGPAAGHRYAVLVLTDTSGAPCRTYGFLGMQLLGSSGTALPTRVVRETSPAAATVTLKSGGSAWAMLRWSVVPADGEPAHGQCEPTPATVQVTPPDDTAHLTMPWSQGMVCASGTIFTTALAPGTGP